MSLPLAVRISEREGICPRDGTLSVLKVLAAFRAITPVSPTTGTTTAATSSPAPTDTAASRPAALTPARPARRPEFSTQSGYAVVVMDVPGNRIPCRTALTQSDKHARGFDLA